MRGRTHTEAFSLFSFQDIITSVTGVLILVTLFLALQLVQPTFIGSSVAPSTSEEQLRRSIEQADEQIKQLQQALRSGQEFLAAFASLSPASLEEEETRLSVTIDRLQNEIRQLDSDIASAQLEKDKLAATSERSPTEETLSALRKQVESLKQQLESLKTTNRIVYNVAPNAKKNAWLVDLAPDSIQVLSPTSMDTKVEFPDGAGRRGLNDFIVWASTRNTSSEYFVLLVRPKTLTKYRQAYEQLDKLGFAIGVDLLERNATLVNSSELVVPNP